MKNYGAFDILGPIMIGPSSSHTAGAARLAKIAEVIAGVGIVKVNFILHGSFARTYRGHGTDRALAAGIMGMNPDDKKLRDSLEIAKGKGIEIEFNEEDLGEVHPNTVKMIITKEDGRIVEVAGSSIGGGNILVYEVDGEPVEFTGEYTTIMIAHKDVPGMIAKVSTILYNHQLNIANMKVFRNSKGLKARMILQTDGSISENIISEMKSLVNVDNVRVIKPLMEGE